MNPTDSTQKSQRQIMFGSMFDAKSILHMSTSEIRTHYFQLQKELYEVEVA